MSSRVAKRRNVNDDEEDEEVDDDDEQKQRSSKRKRKGEKEGRSVSFAEMQAEMAKLRAEVDTKIDTKIAASKADASHKGATTHAQFYQQLSNEDGLKFNCKIWTQRKKWPWKKQNCDPPKDMCPEADKNDQPGVQSHVTTILQALVSHTTALKKAVSMPDPEAFKKTSFGSRKPDVVNYEKNKTGSLSITSFGDLKGRGNGDFTDEEKGHVLDMARSYMTRIGFNRPFIYVFLSDGLRWQFFRVIRKGRGSDLKYEEGHVINDCVQGWEHYLALLMADASTLGYVNPKVKGVTLTQPLGRGGSASVYEGMTTDETDDAVVVKVYDEERVDSFSAEKSALEKLNGIDNVPNLFRVGKLENKVEGTYNEVLLVKPVGKPVLLVCEGLPVNGAHLKSLVVAIQKAHEKDLVHRDLKPENVFLHNNEIILNDWSSSVDAEAHPAEWEGTTGYSVHYSEKEFTKLSPKARDLVNLVRCAHVLLFKEKPPATADKVEEYWKKCFREGTLWADAILQAQSVNYEALGTILSSLK